LAKDKPKLSTRLTRRLRISGSLTAQMTDICSSLAFSNRDQPPKTASPSICLPWKAGLINKPEQSKVRTVRLWMAQDIGDFASVAPRRRQLLSFSFWAYDDNETW
jgi:hypothetical protein